MAINPITFANRVNRQFLRYQMTAFPLSDEQIASQASKQIAGEEGESPLIKGPFVSLSRAYKTGPSIQELIDKKLLHPALEGIAKYPNVFQHQFESLSAVHSGNHVIISTGTGSGKTEAFLYPILNECLAMRDQNIPEGVTAVIVYPMNALAVDQLDRLRELLAGTGITFGMYIGSTPYDESALTMQVRPKVNSRESYLAKRADILRKKSTEVVCPFEERLTEQEMQASPPRILLTNFNQLEILLTRGRDLGMFKDAPLKFLVFDEAHTYSGVKGAEVSLLIRRLRAFAGKTADEVTCIGSSATIYDPEDSDAGKKFASRFFGVDLERIVLVDETYEDQKWSKSLYSQSAYYGNGEAFLDRLLMSLEENEPVQIAQVISELTGVELKLTDNWPEELFEHFQSSMYVKLLFEHLQEPTYLDEAIEVMVDAMGRDTFDLEAGKIELLAILALCGAAIKDDDPLLRPKLHFFVHGLQGAIGVLSESNHQHTKVHFYMSLVKAMEEHQDRLPATFYFVSTCRVCGQHAMETYLEGLTIERRELLGGDAESDNIYWLATYEGSGTRILFTNHFAIEDEEDVNITIENRIRNRTIYMYVCPYCGAFHRHEDNKCANDRCARDVKLLPVSVLLPQREGQVLVGCPSCNTRPFRIHGREVEPFRNFRAVTVADVHILSQDLLNAGKGDDERLIVFTDNRQDAAFQAGWMQDHARRFRLRHLIYHFLNEQTETVSLNEIENFLLKLYDTDRALIKALCPEVFHTHTPQYFGSSTQDTLAKYLRIQVLMEFNTPFKHARSLETWGLVKVFYGDINRNNDKIQEWAEKYDIPPDLMANGISKLLDVWRRNGRMLYDEREPIYSHYWYPSDKEVANGFLPLMDYPPKALKLTRSGNDRDTYITQMLSSGGITLAMGFTRKWGLSPEASNAFLEELWDWLVENNILTPVQLRSNRGNTLPGCGGAHQINSAMLGYETQMDLYQCNVCHRYHNTDSPTQTCTTHHCQGQLGSVLLSQEDYNISTLLKPFTMLMAEEHSAQVPTVTREQIEREFKSPNGNVNTLIATPTLEMGVDIGDLDIILLRNVPPSSANYWQRVGRAGRRYRMAVLYTYCRNSAHDNYFFEDPYLLLRSPVEPPRFNLQNEVMIEKHVHAAILSYMIGITGEMPEEFPTFIDGYLFDDDKHYRASPLDVSQYGELIIEKKEDILVYLEQIFNQYWPDEALDEITNDRLETLVDQTVDKLQEVVNRLFTRMRWTIHTRDEILDIMRDRNLQPAEERLLNRCRDYLKSLAGHSASSYTLTVLASNGYLPGYGTYTGSITGRAERFKTSTGQSIFDFELNRPPSMALREFVPGNLIYANSGKFQVGLFHVPLDQNQMQRDQYVIHPDSEVIEIAGQGRGYGDSESVSLSGIAISDVDLTYVSRISDEETLRFSLPVKIMGLRKETHRGGRSYNVGRNTNLHHLKGQDVRLVNIGPSDRVARGNYGFWVCGICGGVRSPFAVQAVVDQFLEYHRDKCGREPTPLGFSADVTVDGLLFKKLASLETAVNLGEVLKRAAAAVIEMDVEDLQTLSFPQNESEVDLFLYDPMPGGSGLLHQILDNWEEINSAGVTLTDECPHQCETSCYECLRSYRNVFYHELLNRHRAKEILEEIATIEISHDIPENVIDRRIDGESTLPSEDRLGQMLSDEGFPPPQKQYEIPISIEGFPAVKRTTPDFAYPEEKLAVYLDGMSTHIHGNPQTQLIDRLITDELEALNWNVIRIQVTELSDPTVMAIYYRKITRSLSSG